MKKFVYLILFMCSFYQLINAQDLKKAGGSGTITRGTFSSGGQSGGFPLACTFGEAFAGNLENGKVKLQIGAQPGVEIDKRDSLSVSNNLFQVSSVSSQIGLSIFANRSWILNSNQPWLVPNKTSGAQSENIDINILNNTDTIERIGQLTVSSGSKVVLVTILQAKFLTSIENLVNLNPILIYPNPNNGLFFIQMPEKYLGMQASLMDQYGNSIFKKEIENALFEISIEKLKSGIYILEIMDGNTCSYSKIVVQDK